MDPTRPVAPVDGSREVGPSSGDLSEESLDLVVPHRPSECWPPATIERGLLALALHGGNTRAAAQELAARGEPVPSSTLQYWKERSHVERYEQVHREVLPRIQETMAREAEGMALGYAERVYKTLDRYDETLADLKPGDVAGALRNLTVGFGVSVDKSNIMRGRPTARVEHKSVEESIRKLAGQGVIDVEWTEVPGPELPPSSSGEQGCSPDGEEGI